MKKLLLLIPFTILIACTTPLRYNTIINDIPTQYPNFNTEIRFVGDSVTNKPYFEVLDINLELRGLFDAQTLRKRLELEAIREGVDAIIDVEYYDDSYDKINGLTLLYDVLTENEGTTTKTVFITYVRGTGIMYLENLDFIGDRPEYEYYYKIDERGGLPEPFLKIEYKLTGQEHMVYPAEDNALDIYNKYIKFYSDFHLFRQRERWEYTMAEGRIKKRFLINQSHEIKKTVTPKYDSQGRVITVSIAEYRKSGVLSDRITIEYDSSNRIKSRLISIGQNAKVFENWFYENGKLARREVIINTPEAKTIYLRSSILYYHPDYLKDYYLIEYSSKTQGIANTH